MQTSEESKLFKTVFQKTPATENKIRMIHVMDSSPPKFFKAMYVSICPGSRLKFHPVYWTYHLTQTEYVWFEHPESNPGCCNPTQQARNADS